MSFRRVLKELEAKLTPDGHAPAIRNATGKLEYKHYGDGKQRLKFRCRGLELPDGERLELTSGDALIVVLEVEAGRVSIDEEKDIAAEAPPLAVGNTVALRRNGDSLLSGLVYLD